MLKHNYISICLLLAIFLIAIPSNFAFRKYTKRNNDNDTLELVHVIFRHGDRTPDKSIIYPNDPHINQTYYPIGFGQLTNAGKRKEYILGKALRKRYGKFLGKYNIETVDARCTDYNRTKMSLQLVLASLFPPEDELVWEKRLKWQPVPFNYWTVQDDHVLGDPYKNCPKFIQEYHNYLNSHEGLNLFEDQTKLMQYLSAKTGTSITSKKSADLYFTLTTEKENGMDLPEWTDSVYPHHIKHLAVLEYNISTFLPILRKLSSGFLVKKIIDDSKLKILGKLSSKTKMFLYSAHEYNLAYLLRYLGLFYSHVPPYGGYILIEVHNIRGIRGIKVFYENYENDKPTRLKLPGCENFCRFEKFAKLYENYLPASEKECEIIDEISSR